MGALNTWEVLIWRNHTWQTQRQTTTLILQSLMSKQCNLLYSWIHEGSRWSKSFVLIGQSSASCPLLFSCEKSFLFNHLLINLLSTKLVQSRRLDIGSFCIVIVLDFVSFHKEEDISFSLRDNAVVLSPIWFMAFTYCFSKNSVNALRPENECLISGLYP